MWINVETGEQAVPNADATLGDVVEFLVDHDQDVWVRAGSTTGGVEVITAYLPGDTMPVAQYVWQA